VQTQKRMDQMIVTKDQQLQGLQHNIDGLTKDNKQLRAEVQLL
jgi:regulator of replication initiation timing